MKAVETVDACLEHVYRAVRQRGGAMLITADHGNAEQMIDPATGGPHTAHTTNPVPLIAISEDAKQFTLSPTALFKTFRPRCSACLAFLNPKR